MLCTHAAECLAWLVVIAAEDVGCARLRPEEPASQPWYRRCSDSSAFRSASVHSCRYMIQHLAFVTRQGVWGVSYPILYLSDPPRSALRSAERAGPIRPALVRGVPVGFRTTPPHPPRSHLHLPSVSSPPPGPWEALDSVSGSLLFRLRAPPPGSLASPRACSTRRRVAHVGPRHVRRARGRLARCAEPNTLRTSPDHPPSQ